jgi:hypothetical protein
VAQANIFAFGKFYLIEKTVALVNICGKHITAHLIDYPDNIITRTSTVTESTAPSVPNLFGLPGIAPAGGGRLYELNDLVSKLVQYHAIKYPSRQLEAIYLMGNDADNEALNALAAANHAPVFMVDDAFVPKLPPESQVRSLIYSIGASLGSDG